MLHKKIIAALLLAVPSLAFAGQFSGSVTVAPGQAATINFQFAGDGATDNADVRLDYNNTHFTISNPVGASAGDTCQIVSATRIRVVPRDGAGTPLPSTPTTYCSFTVTANAMAAEGTYDFTVATISCTDPKGPVTPCTLAAGSAVTIQNTPVPRTLSYDPAAGSTITFAAGMTPGAAAPGQTIQVTANGNSGTATLSGCAITGAGASAFSVAPTSLTFNDMNPGPANLNLGCTYPTSNATATLTCTEVDGDTAAPGAARTWNLSCPAPNVAPTVTSATPSPVTVSAATQGTQGTATIDLVAANGSGAGSTAVSCTSTGNVLIAASPGTPAGQGPVAFNVVGTAQPTDIRVGVVLTANAQAPAGTVTCTVSGQPDIVVAVNAPAGTVFVPPQFIPSTSTWSTLALLGLLGLFGMLAVGFRRNG